MWDGISRKLYGIRQGLMSGLGNIEMREAVWEKQYFKGADGDGEEKDQKLEVEEVEKLCKRLNIKSSKEELLRLFKVRFLWPFYLQIET
jgi:phosphatidylinositol phospholipase C, delta